LWNGGPSDAICGPLDYRPPSGPAAFDLVPLQFKGRSSPRDFDEHGDAIAFDAIHDACDAAKDAGNDAAAAAATPARSARRSHVRENVRFDATGGDDVLDSKGGESHRNSLAGDGLNEKTRPVTIKSTGRSEGKRMASGHTGNVVPGNRLRVRVPCPPLK
jgi:hypothetical protein